jgi:hypothetical protein
MIRLLVSPAVIGLLSTGGNHCLYKSNNCGWDQQPNHELIYHKVLLGWATTYLTPTRLQFAAKNTRDKHSSLSYPICECQRNSLYSLDPRSSAFESGLNCLTFLLRPSNRNLFYWAELFSDTVSCRVCDCCTSVPCLIFAGKARHLPIEGGSTWIHRSRLMPYTLNV